MCDKPDFLVSFPYFLLAYQTRESSVWKALLFC
nr:MAG TPA: hypothetical protein [Bacteriophage sp.]